MNQPKEWTLFLDRDGVINQRIPGTYIKDWKDFHFTSGMLETISQICSFFTRVFIVTNQQGIGKGLMTEDELAVIHRQMKDTIVAHHGRIDGIYSCPDLASRAGNCRKPNPALALQAQADFPAVSFTRAVMVGDSISDIQFGQQLGMRTVLIDTKEDEKEQWTLAKAAGLNPDLTLPKLSDLASYLPALLA